MAPTSAYMIQNEYHDEPISRTYQYRKVMKPMLERKRRARINRCLDELKELMITTLQSEGENVSKLEKADILELTVRHLQQLKRQNQLIHNTNVDQQSYAERFRAGFTHCATEVSHFLTNETGRGGMADYVDPVASAKLLQHLGTCIRHLETNQVPANQYYSQQQQTSPVRIQQQQQCQLKQCCNQQKVSTTVSMWRPW